MWCFSERLSRNALNPASRDHHDRILKLRLPPLGRFRYRVACAGGGRAGRVGFRQRAGCDRGHGRRLRRTSPRSSLGCNRPNEHETDPSQKKAVRPEKENRHVREMDPRQARSDARRRSGTRRKMRGLKATPCSFASSKRELGALRTLFAPGSGSALREVLKPGRNDGFRKYSN